MLLTPWLNKFRSKTTWRTRKPRHANRTGLQLQNLEDRVLLAASISEATPDLNDGIIIEGTNEINLTFSEDVQGADQASNYSLIGSGADDIFGTADDSNIALTASYADSVATLLFSSLQEGRYRLTVHDSITDTATSSALDGDNNGTAGGEWVRDYHTARIVPVGEEFQVNTYTAGDQVTSSQQHQSIAMDAVGNFVITWSSQNQEQYRSSWGVYGQRFDANGIALGEEFQVNSFESYPQENSTVAMDSAGNFIVTWSSLNQDGSLWGVYGQRFDSNGNPQGNEFQINTHESDNQQNSTVAMDDAGNFIVTWSSFDQDSSGWGVYGQRYAADGTALGGEFQINTEVNSYQSLQLQLELP